MDDLCFHPRANRAESKQLPHKEVRKIGVAFNLKQEPAADERSDKYAEFDDLGTIEAIRAALNRAGYEVALLEADQDFVYRLKDSNVDFVFNIAEGMRGESRESHVPAILELLDIPYTGSGVLTQAITLHKSRKKEILAYYGIPTPRWQVFTNTNQRLDPNLRFPLIVKPNAEGSSVGITNDSLITDAQALNKQVNRVLREYSQPALVEEYIDGREFTLSLLGNPPEVLPIVEINFEHLPRDIHRFDSWEAKWVYDNPASPVDAIIVPADLEPKLKAQLEEVARRTFGTLGCVDFARTDIRLDRQGVPHVLDVNALPGLMPDPKENSRFTRSCYAAGMTYDEMVIAILDCAFERTGRDQRRRT
jgi:D-alanine-D-alanine ligase